MSGAILPDWTGTYLPDGLYNGKVSWKMAGESRYLFYGLPSTDWYIAAAKADDPMNCWFRHDGPWGEYAHVGSHTGEATVEAIIE